MTEERLAEIDARAAAATKAPWHEAGDCVRDSHDRDLLIGEPNAETRLIKDVEADARFAAHARQDVPDMAAEIRYLKNGFIDKRPETGPMQFPDDWPGLFIRGDDAFHLYTQMSLLRQKLQSQNVDLGMFECYLSRMIKWLDSSNMANDPKCQQARRLAEEETETSGL